MTLTPYDIIKTVRVTEKGTVQTEKFNRYTLVVDPRASKPEIRAAVQELFKVTVVRVNTMNMRGKLRRQRTKHAGREAHWKKAIVTLKDGDKIQLA
jgi:large subunit ribosomal protein L23